MTKIKSKFNQSKTYIGIELGSTRIKAVLINEHNQVLAIGIYNWENKLINNYWTYPRAEIIKGLQNCYRALKTDVFKKFQIKLTNPAAIGISGMMHGYLVLDKNNNLLVPFRTWRNTSTKQAVDYLSPYLNFNIPQRWSVAHLYQAILDKENHVNKIAYITTLAGYIHYLLTGNKVVGIGEASGMFPIDTKFKQFDTKRIEKMNRLFDKHHVSIEFNDIFPKVLLAGMEAGTLTEAGAVLLDPERNLKPGIIFCPPEGDAGTGMVATNAIKPKTGNVSAGTSVFGMIVLKENLPKWYEEVDMVTTPDGYPVAMIHCNNCSTDINNWVNMFDQYNKLMGFKIQTKDLFESLLSNIKTADLDNGNILSCNYYSGEPITHFTEGRPMLLWQANSNFTLANLFKTLFYTSLVTLKIGFDFLKREKVLINNIVAHGGLFTTKDIGQTILSAALNTKVTVNKNASEGGPYGMAILAKYLLNNKMSLSNFLTKDVFINNSGITVKASVKETKSFERYAQRFKKILNVEKEAITQIGLMVNK